MALKFGYIPTANDIIHAPNVDNMPILFQIISKCFAFIIDTFLSFFLKMDRLPLLRLGGSSVGVVGGFPISSPLSDVWDVVLLYHTKYQFNEILITEIC
jgi:hypothetical protein